MNSAIKEFDDAIRAVKEQGGFYDYLVQSFKLPEAYTSEILRSQLVCAVSAMDRFFHEVVRIGFIESYKGIRIQTDSFKQWAFSNETMLQIIRYSDSAYTPTSQLDTPEFLIEQDVIRKLSYIAYQHPDKIKEALSFIWAESHKMQSIAVKMGLASTGGQKLLEQKLRLICERRNQVVHEGDIEPTTRQRRKIYKVDVVDNVDFIDSFCHSTFDLITDSRCYISSPPTTA